MGMTVASLQARRFPDSSAADVHGVERVLFISDGSVQEKDDKLDLSLCQVMQVLCASHFLCISNFSRPYF
jgi:hypothetical protein